MSDQLISAIRVQGLFGLYSYTLPKTGELSNATILYGDNGLGKSTILRLAFHLLSASDSRGHRTALYETPFEKLEVDLASGLKLTASRISNPDQRVLELAVFKSEGPIAIWDYIPASLRKSERSESDAYYLEMVELTPGKKTVLRKRKNSDLPFPSVPRGENVYIRALKESSPAAFILNADRRLDSDEVPDPSDEIELRRLFNFQEPKRINDLVVRSREIALSQALSNAARWIGRKAVQGSNRGSMNVHSAYGNVLRHLVAPVSAKNKSTEVIDINSLLGRLTTIETKTNEFSRYELETPLSMAEFKKALGARAQTKRELAANLLEPYVRSLEGRNEALDPIYRIIDQFIKIVNGLLQDKSIKFDLSHGFSIANRLGTPLEPSQLSSGEQQLLLLFCYVLTARDKSSVFMIDEPEISLNIKWQRQLIQSLLDITSNSNIQFIFASHSLELLTQHKSRVVKLEKQV